MAKWAHRYAQLGFTVLLPAQRAHELSEGRYVGMGLLESDDLLGWVSLITAADPDARILLHGNSMGAATVMMAAGDCATPPQRRRRDFRLRIRFRGLAVYG